MSTLFKKVVSAFVVFPEDEKRPEPYVPSFARPSGSSSPSTTLTEDALANDAAELLKQLEAGTAKLDMPPMPSSPSAPPVTAADLAAAPAAPPPADPMEMTADQVFSGAGLADTPDSAYRVLKMIAALAVFPPAQQVAMIRAMDSADESWSEEGVLVDARKRRGALKDHLDRVAADRDKKRQGLDGQIRDSQSKGDALISDIDKQIAELQSLREAAVRETTEAISKLENEQHELDARVDRILQNFGQVDEELERLIRLFEHGGKPAR